MHGSDRIVETLRETSMTSTFLNAAWYRVRTFKLVATVFAAFLLYSCTDQAVHFSTKDAYQYRRVPCNDSECEHFIEPGDDFTVDVQRNSTCTWQISLGGKTATDEYDQYEATKWTLIETPDALPPGLLIEFNPSQVDPDTGITKLKIQADASVPLGTYVFTVNTDQAMFDHIRMFKLVVKVTPDNNPNPDTWSTVGPSTSIPILHDVAFASSTTGVAVGHGGSIVRTTDAGLSWNTITSGSSSDLWEVDFLDANLGYAVGDNVVLRTLDGGASWTAPVTGLIGRFRHLNIWDLNSFSVCDIGTNSNFQLTQYNSVDRGVTYTKGWVSSNVSAVWYRDQQRIVLVRNEGSGQRLYSTTDGGTLWKTGAALSANINHITSGPALRLYGSSSMGQILQSNDDGDNWFSVPTGAPSVQYQGIHFRNNHGIAAGTLGAVARSTDGSTWSYEPTNAQNTFESVAVVNDDIAVIVGFKNSTSGYQGLIMRRQ